MRFSSYAPHGPVHVALGGVHGCTAAYDSLEGVIHKDDLKRLRANAFVSLKNGWRRYVVEPPAEAACAEADDDARSSSTCRYSCSGVGVGNATQGSAAAVKTMWHALFDFMGRGFLDKYDHPARAAAVAAVCAGTVVPGDQLEASSPVDPTFWPIHPAVERVFAARLAAGGFKNLSWANPDAAKPTQYCMSAFPGGTPPWLAGSAAYNGNRCLGHHADDDLDAYYPGAAAALGGGRLTNEGLLGRIDPRERGAGAAYVYEHFEWGHCETSQAGEGKD